MPVSPLTHHDIIRRSAPLTRSGLKVNLGACDRSNRYIEFEARTQQNGLITVIHALEVDEDSKQLFSRVVVHRNGLVSVLSAVVQELSDAIVVFDQIPVTRQITITDNYTVARSYLLAPDYRAGKALAVLQLRYVCAYVAGLQLRIDTSTGGGMPADVWLMPQGTASAYLRNTLADGSDVPLDHRAAARLRSEAMATRTNRVLPKIPDDILAVLGVQWRPLRYQGDYWKGVLRGLSKKETRTARAEAHVEEALDHLHNTLSAAPDEYQTTHSKARWRVYFRRLKPLMLFIAILMLMPISWLFVSSGTIGIHPLALGLTPLLMVGVVVLTAREIPVMEIPPRPDALPATAWHPATEAVTAETRITETITSDAVTTQGSDLSLNSSVNDS